jgi:small-conductance mechanosensitive channel/CRP-like cAMP-binding protein
VEYIIDVLSDIFDYIWHPSLIWIFPLMILMSVTLARLKRVDGRTLYISLGLFLFSLLALLVSGLVREVGQENLAWMIRGTGFLVEGLAVIRLSGPFVFRVLMPLVRFSPASILEDLAVIFGYLIWIMVRLRYAGLDLSSILTTSAVITAVLAFAMQDTLGNILGGLALQLDNSIKKGDWIKLNDINGRVVDIRWRSTLVETRNWETVIIPNSTLMKNDFQVLGMRTGQPRQWRRWIWFNLDYGIQPQRVIALVEKALRGARIPHLAADPAPNCLMMDFDIGTSSARYAVRYWLTDLAHDDPTGSVVRIHVFTALKRAGMRPARPLQTIHMIKETEDQSAHQQAREHARALAALRRVEIFAPLDEDEFLSVAEHLVQAPFAEGSIITRQGAVAHRLYILIGGEVEIVLEDNGQKRTLNILRAGEPNSFFGEMGLLTGEPRTASILARTEVECYELNKAAFEHILKARPEVAEGIASLVASRQIQLDAMRHQMSTEASHLMRTRRETELTAKIRRFFALN